MSPKFQYLTVFRMSTAMRARAIQFARPPTTALTAFLLGATSPLVALEPFLATNMDDQSGSRC